MSPLSDPKPRQRRALSHVGGATLREGDPVAAATLAAALDVPTSAEAEDAARAHAHGFHAYPARMHPLTARRLVEAFAPPKGTVLDPFCGSGTVVLEARLAGRRAVGVDNNPLATRLALLKVRGTTEAERARWLAAAHAVSQVAEDRRKARSGPTHRYGRDDVALFDAHVLLELDGLRLGLDQLPDRAVRADLELVLSSILVKVSRRASDTSAARAGEPPRRIAAGYPSRLFVKKTEELCRRLAEIEAPLAAAPPPRILEGDARRLDGIHDGSIDLALTSPPYPGTYDYLAHHAARLRWLRLSERRFAETELGARRHLEPLGAAAGSARWQNEVSMCLRALGRVLAPGGSAILLLADSVIAGAPVYATDVLRAVAPAAGLRLHAIASQARPHFHGPSAHAFARRPRQEHAILLIRTGAPTTVVATKEPPRGPRRIVSPPNPPRGQRRR